MAQRRKNEQNKYSIIINVSTVHLYNYLRDFVGVSAMNDLVTKEMLEVGAVSDEVLDKLEEYKTLNEWFDTFKFEFKKACEEYGIKKWETDYFLMNYIEDTFTKRVDTNRMKNENIYVVNAESGELEEANAYEYFSKPSLSKAHVTYKEKK